MNSCDNGTVRLAEVKSGRKTKNGNRESYSYRVVYVASSSWAPSNQTQPHLYLTVMLSRACPTQAAAAAMFTTVIQPFACSSRPRSCRIRSLRWRNLFSRAMYRFFASLSFAPVLTRGVPYHASRGVGGGTYRFRVVTETTDIGTFAIRANSAAIRCRFSVSARGRHGCRTSPRKW